MTFRRIAASSFLVILAYLLFVDGMSDRGLVGPDEPRYAAVAREMAGSGDWITPRLDGQPWFEKPALLYWMGSLAAKLGLSDDRATRLPVALMSLGFLIFYYFQIRGEFGSPAAEYATTILGTAAGWVAFSQIGVFDLPLTVSLSAALLLLLGWTGGHQGPSPRRLSAFGALVGVSALAKGLVGPALAVLAILPVCFNRGFRSVVTQLLHPRVVLPFAVIALPWYVLCYLENGQAFFDEFFWRHHFDRLTSESIRHSQPVWYFIPVLLAAFLPWTPLLGLLLGSGRGDGWRQDGRLRFLGFWALFTVVFFSLVRNKLPGYILPALPPLAALMGVRLARTRSPGLALGASALLLVLVPLAEALLPQALSRGLVKAWPPESISWAWVVATITLAGVIWWAARRCKKGVAFTVLGSFAAASFIYLKIQVFPAIDRVAGTRTLWRQVEPHLAETCLGEVRRHALYGLRYYSSGQLPDCSSQPRPHRVESDPAVFAGP